MYTIIIGAQTFTTTTPSGIDDTKVQDYEIGKVSDDISSAKILFVNDGTVTVKNGEPITIEVGDTLPLLSAFIGYVASVEETDESVVVVAEEEIAAIGSILITNDYIGDGDDDFINPTRSHPDTGNNPGPTVRDEHYVNLEIFPYDSSLGAEPIHERFPFPIVAVTNDPVPSTAHWPPLVSYLEQPRALYNPGFQVFDEFFITEPRIHNEDLSPKFPISVVRIFHPNNTTTAHRNGASFAQGFSPKHDGYIDRIGVLVFYTNDSSNDPATFNSVRIMAELWEAEANVDGEWDPYTLPIEKRLARWQVGTTDAFVLAAKALPGDLPIETVNELWGSMSIGSFGAKKDFTDVVQISKNKKYWLIVWALDEAADGGNPPESDWFIPFMTGTRVAQNSNDSPGFTMNNLVDSTNAIGYFSDSKSHGAIDSTNLIGENNRIAGRGVFRINSPPIIQSAISADFFNADQVAAIKIVYMAQRQVKAGEHFEMLPFSRRIVWAEKSGDKIANGLEDDIFANFSTLNLLLFDTTKFSLKSLLEDFFEKYAKTGTIIDIDPALESVHIPHYNARYKNPSEVLVDLAKTYQLTFDSLLVAGQRTIKVTKNDTGSVVAPSLIVKNARDTTIAAEEILISTSLKRQTELYYNTMIFQGSDIIRDPDETQENYSDPVLVRNIIQVSDYRSINDDTGPNFVGFRRSIPIKSNNIENLRDAVAIARKTLRESGEQTFSGSVRIATERPDLLGKFIEVTDTLRNLNAERLLVNEIEIPGDGSTTLQVGIKPDDLMKDFQAQDQNNNFQYIFLNLRKADSIQTIPPFIRNSVLLDEMLYVDVTAFKVAWVTVPLADPFTSVGTDPAAANFISFDLSQNTFISTRTIDALGEDWSPTGANPTNYLRLRLRASDRSLYILFKIIDFHGNSRSILIQTIEADVFEQVRINFDDMNPEVTGLGGFDFDFTKVSKIEIDSDIVQEGTLDIDNIFRDLAPVYGIQFLYTNVLAPVSEDFRNPFYDTATNNDLTRPFLEIWDEEHNTVTVFWRFSPGDLVNFQRDSSSPFNGLLPYTYLWDPTPISLLMRALGTFGPFSPEPIISPLEKLDKFYIKPNAEVVIVADFSLDSTAF